MLASIIGVNVCLVGYALMMAFVRRPRSRVLSATLIFDTIQLKKVPPRKPKTSASASAPSRPNIGLATGPEEVERYIEPRDIGESRPGTSCDRLPDSVAADTAAAATQSTRLEALLFDVYAPMSAAVRASGRIREIRECTARRTTGAIAGAPTLAPEPNIDLGPGEVEHMPAATQSTRLEALLFDVYAPMSAAVRASERIRQIRESTAGLTTGAIAGAPTVAPAGAPAGAAAGLVASAAMDSPDSSIESPERPRQSGNERAATREPQSGNERRALQVRGRALSLARGRPSLRKAHMSTIGSTSSQPCSPLSEVELSI